MKKTLFFGFLFVLSLSFFSQEKEIKSLIKVDTTWAKEIFHFPISFAPRIPFEGFEEARFPLQGWSDENHPNFWSYAFAWNINLSKKITEDELEKYLKIYFDGLNRNNDFKTSASIQKIKTDNNVSNFKGKLIIYDRFTTKKSLNLNVLIESKLCERNQKSTILFKFSPKEFNHKTWEMMKKIELLNTVCD